jgi:hypothetical protein
MKITFTKEHQEKKPGTKTVWVTMETETGEMDWGQYQNFVNAASFFRRLGGSCYQQKSYTCRGYNVVKDINTAPSGEIRSITKFKFY